MFSSRCFIGVQGNRTPRFVAIALSLTAVLLASGCGSTKTVTADKTVSYQGSIYNVSDVRQLTTRMEGETSSGESIELGGLDRKQFEELVEQQGPLKVTSLIVMDELRVVHQQKSVGRGRDFTSMQENLADAFEDLQRFLADADETQLKLKPPR